MDRELDRQGHYYRDRVTYVIVPVRIGLPDGPELVLDDDGDPGPWGNTYVYDASVEEGEWVVDPGAQTEAWNYVRERLSNGG